MTKKDYERLADALKSEKPGKNWDPNKMVQWELCCKAICNALADDNRRFNRSKFLMACDWFRE